MLIAGLLLGGILIAGWGILTFFDGVARGPDAGNIADGGCVFAIIGAVVFAAGAILGIVRLVS